VLPPQLDAAAEAIVPNPTAKTWETLYDAAVWQFDISTARFWIVERFNKGIRVL
jgi:hypothetical protein